MSVPLVAPRLPGPGRPLWSVMIPTWEPDPAYLLEALRSVLTQVHGSGAFQVMVVDDASSQFDGEAFLRSNGAGRVGFHRHPRHLGIAGNWNECLQLARGHLVHVLHQDDFVRDGFYARVAAGLAAHPEAGAAFVQPRYVDAAGRDLPRGIQAADRSGILDSWIDHIFVKLKFACAGVVVRRSVYERLGGFDSRFRYCLDWDMWQRIAVSTPIWYEPDRLACCRIHSASATGRLLGSGRNVREVAQSIERGRAYLAPEIGPAVAARARREYVQWALGGARRLFDQGRPLVAMTQLWGARRLGFSAIVWPVLRQSARAGWRRTGARMAARLRGQGGRGGRSAELGGRKG